MNSEHFLSMRNAISSALRELNSRNTTTTICTSIPESAVDMDTIGNELFALESHFALANDGWHIDLIPVDAPRCGCGAESYEDYVEYWHIQVRLLPPLVDCIIPPSWS